MPDFEMQKKNEFFHVSFQGGFSNNVLSIQISEKNWIFPKKIFTTRKKDKFEKKSLIMGNKNLCHLGADFETKFFNLSFRCIFQILHEWEKNTIFFSKKNLTTKKKANLEKKISYHEKLKNTSFFFHWLFPGIFWEWI